jgi:hypothetical protein
MCCEIGLLATGISCFGVSERSKSSAITAVKYDSFHVKTARGNEYLENFASKTVPAEVEA